MGIDRRPQVHLYQSDRQFYNDFTRNTAIPTQVMHQIAAADQLLLLFLRPGPFTLLQLQQNFCMHLASDGIKVGQH